MPLNTVGIDFVAVRREILQLLQQQIEALDSPLGVSDETLRECYERQARVHELRENLQAGANAQQAAAHNLEQNPALTCAAIIPLDGAASL